MTTVLRKMAKAEGAGIQDEDGIERVLAAPLQHGIPAAGHFLVAARTDHWIRIGFDTAWQAAASAAGAVPRIRPEYGMSADSGFQPSVPRHSVLRSVRLHGVRLGS